MSEWKGNSSAQELRIGDVQAVAGVNGTAIVYASVERTAPRQLGMGAAKSAAEQALREMHNALSEHFAPVLRWDHRGMWSDARVGVWHLQASVNHWMVYARKTTLVASGVAQSIEESRRAAEAALRALGVPFRVEGES